MVKRTPELGPIREEFGKIEKRETEEPLDVRLEKLSDEVKELRLKDEGLWKEKRGLLRSLVNEKINLIKEEIKEGDKESFEKAAEKIALTKFLYLWEPGMYNHKGYGGYLQRLLKEGLCSRAFAKRTKLERIGGVYGKEEIHAYGGERSDLHHCSSAEYLWGRVWPEGHWGITFDPIVKSKGKKGVESLFNRVNPRFFLSIFHGTEKHTYQPKEATESEYSPKESPSYYHRVCRDLANIGYKAWENKPELAIPIASVYGELLWPKYLNMREVLAITGDSEGRSFIKVKKQERKKLRDSIKKIVSPEADKEV